jgi:hypothetical protein
MFCRPPDHSARITRTRKASRGAAVAIWFRLIAFDLCTDHSLAGGSWSVGIESPWGVTLRRTLLALHRGQPVKVLLTGRRLGIDANYRRPSFTTPGYEQLDVCIAGMRGQRRCHEMARKGRRRHRNSTRRVDGHSTGALRYAESKALDTSLCI